jgi:hypothetical protein
VAVNDVSEIEKLSEKELDLEDELQRVRSHREALQPIDPGYLQKRQAADAEILRLTVKLDGVREKLYSADALDDSDSTETTAERDDRLQRRFNELYAQTKSKKKACHLLAEEEREKSRITVERLTTIMRVPR